MYIPTALWILVNILIVSNGADPTTFFHSGPKNYYMTPTKTNFFAARDHCIEHNADLATFESIGELEAVSNYLIQNGFNSEAKDLFWVSYWDLGRRQGMFHSIATGQLLTTSGWTPGQPDNAGGVEHCVHIWKRAGSYGMNDNNCNVKLRAICQQRTYHFPQNCCQYRPRNSTC